MVLLGAVNIAAAAVKKEVRKKTGTIILSKTLLASVITLACAVIIFLVSYFFGKNRWVNLVIGVLGTAIFLVAVYKIKITDLDKMVLKIDMGTGLWLTLWSYLFMGLAGLAMFAVSFKKSK